jgi:hypothetical protein
MIARFGAFVQSGYILGLQWILATADRGCGTICWVTFMATDLWNAISPWFVAAVGGAIGAALLLPTKFGEVLFKYRFDQAIEDYKAQQGRELERLREQLNHLGDRGRRSNEFEFGAIREVWEKITKAFLATGSCVANVIEYSDLNQLTPEDLEAFLSATGFSDGQVDQIRKAPDHLDMYLKIVTWKSIANAAQENFETNLLLRERRIFMPDTIRSQFQGVIDLLNAARVERKLQFQHPSIPRNQWGNAINRFFNEGDNMFNALAAVDAARVFLGYQFL